MILVGELALWVALLVSVWAATVSCAGGAQRRDDLIASGERGVHAALAMALLATLGLSAALVTRDFSLAHVAGNTSANLPLLYTLAALWAGPAGSLLLLTLVLSLCAAAAVRGGGRSRGPSSPFATGTLGAVLSFHLAALCLDVSPFARMDWQSLDGLGMSPSLQHPGMAVHPPMLYLGIAATAVLFALAVAAAVDRAQDGKWMETTRRWVLLAWVFLTTGIVLGMWWAYSDPAAEAGWMRDAISNGSLAPWLACTLLLPMATDAGARTPRRRHLVLMLAAFPLAVAGLVVLRGGMIAEVHSFPASAVRSWMAGFLVFLVGTATYLILSRIVPAGGDLASRTGGRAGTGPTQVSRATIGIGAVGALLVAAGFAGGAFSSANTVTVGPGQAAALEDPFGRAWQFAGLGVSQYNELNRHVVAAAVVVSRGARPVGTVTAAEVQHVNSRGTPTGQPARTPGVIHTPLQDVYVVLREVGDDERVTVQVGFNPLIGSTWAGGALLVSAGVLALVAAARRRVG